MEPEGMRIERRGQLVPTEHLSTTWLTDLINLVSRVFTDSLLEVSSHLYVKQCCGSQSRILSSTFYYVSNTLLLIKVKSSKEGLNWRSEVGTTKSSISLNHCPNTLCAFWRTAAAYDNKEKCLVLSPGLELKSLWPARALTLQLMAITTTF